MKRNLNIKPLHGKLNYRDVLALSNQLCGSPEVAFGICIDGKILYGDFVIVISQAEILAITGCTSVPIMDSLTPDMNTRYTFRCIVVYHNLPRTFVCQISKKDEPRKLFVPEPACFCPENNLTIFFIWEYSDTLINFDIAPDDEREPTEAHLTFTQEIDPEPGSIADDSFAPTTLSQLSAAMNLFQDPGVNNN
jgi:hypothetical protein